MDHVDPVHDQRDGSDALNRGTIRFSRHNTDQEEPITWRISRTAQEQGNNAEKRCL